jgi:hypothetical protein
MERDLKVIRELLHIKRIARIVRASGTENYAELD